jgi:raffinose/stachyose/melibiose transport system permease protein
MTIFDAMPRRRRRKGSIARSRRIGSIGRHALLLFASAIVLLPIVYTLIASFKDVPEFFGNPYGLPNTWRWENYSRAWSEAKIAITLPNSIIVTLLAVIGSTALAGLVAYGISRREKPFALALYLLFVSGMLVPVQMIVLPLFIFLKAIGLFGTLFALILPYIALGLPLGVLILTPLVATLPRDLGDAARVDGATELQIFWRVILPLMRPGLASIAILNGVWMWNDFFIPLIISVKSSTQTLPVGIMSFVGVYSTEWGLVFASVVVSAAPIVIAYLAMTRQFVAGLTAGALKG